VNSGNATFNELNWPPTDMDEVCNYNQLPASRVYYSKTTKFLTKNTGKLTKTLFITTPSPHDHLRKRKQRRITN